MQNVTSKSISSFIFTSSLILLIFSSMNLLIEYTSNYYMTGDVNIFKFLFDFEYYLSESSVLHYNEQLNKILDGFNCFIKFEHGGLDTFMNNLSPLL